MFETSSFKKALKQIEKENIPLREKLFRKRLVLNKVEELGELLDSPKMRYFYEKQSVEINKVETELNAKESGIKWP